MSIIYFLVLIGVLILVHEAGHFVVAKAFNVKVLRFSLGFGPTAVAFQRGETEYAICWLPLGGYVKMLGEQFVDEIAPEDRERALDYKPRWQRALIMAAGPFANFVLPTVIFFFSGLMVSQTISSTVGTVLSDRPAERAGLETGDRIIAINGEEVEYWQDVTDIINDSIDEELTLTVLRDGEQVEIKVTPESRTKKDRLGLTEQTVGVIGIMPLTFDPVIGISDPDSPAIGAGLMTFDKIVSIDGEEVETFIDIVRLIKHAEGKQVELGVLRPQQLAFPTGDLFKSSFITLHLTAELRDGEWYTGMQPSEMFVYTVTPGSPAAAVGLMPGDCITHLDGRRYNNFDVLYEEIRSDPESERTLTFVRAGVSQTVAFKPQKIEYEGEFKEEVIRIQVGVYTMQRPHAPHIVPVPILDRLVISAVGACTSTYDFMRMMIVGIVRLIQGKLSLKTVGGPIMIYDIAGKAGSEGIDNFLGMMALISINLGLVNLLPIPILDGGHLMLLGIEAIKRKPLSERARQIAAYIGLTFIVFLMILAFKNDIERYWSDIVGWF